MREKLSIFRIHWVIETEKAMTLIVIKWHNISFRSKLIDGKIDEKKHATFDCHEKKKPSNKLISLTES